MILKDALIPNISSELQFPIAYYKQFWESYQNYYSSLIYKIARSYPALISGNSSRMLFKKISALLATHYRKHNALAVFPIVIFNNFDWLVQMTATGRFPDFHCRCFYFLLFCFSYLVTPRTPQTPRSPQVMSKASDNQGQQNNIPGNVY